MCKRRFCSLSKDHMTFNENTRVKIPAILHLTKLGYKYLSLKSAVRDERTNIFTDIFKTSILRLNENLKSEDLDKILEELTLKLDYDDLGQEFYKFITLSSGIKYIDFDDFSNNTFNVVTELVYKNGDEEFRPDITILINGLPIAFIEVKKPNNKEGILAERNRINSRFKNKSFKRFINITQLLVFTNNMEYDTESIVPIQGAFYATPAYGDVSFNCFREENHAFDQKLEYSDETVENAVLKDNNLSTIKGSPEFIENKKITSPTNRLLSSLFKLDRIRDILKYGIAYVQGENGLEKHIMRYQQFFATKAIESHIDEDKKKGIIWHTQGSGKTALAYYNVNYLTDYFQKKNVIAKFYFIVDRLDLLIQADREFSSRGLIVHTVNSRDELIQDFKTTKVIHNFSGKREITVVNIQKFKDDPDLLRSIHYDLNIQRVYFLDEVHRSYDPNGSFLANLYSSDRNAILIGLTGTPLISTDRKSRDIFGDYIHKYYYNSSIADGYTLKLIREGIETKYRIQLNKILQELEVLKGDSDKRVIYAHTKFVEPMLDYIIEDFTNSRIRFDDATIGSMVVCDSSDQAKKMFDIFNEKYASDTKLKSALILHDVGDKTIRKQEVQEFKSGKIDILFVYNMLLTGFDSKRLKKLYLGRVVRGHNLLQTLTRVNRPYKNFKYGYVVDFADIRNEFDTTNKAYFEELQQELGEDFATYSSLFKSKEEIDEEIQAIKESLFSFDLKNSEIFSRQISELREKEEVLSIKKSLEQAKNLYNLIRLEGHYDLLDKIDFKKLAELYNEVSRHLDLINLKDSLEKNSDSTNLLNTALEDVVFLFKKISESELVIADELKNTLKKTREALGGNQDQSDPEYVALYEELKRLFKKKNLDEVSQEEMKVNIAQLNSIYDRIVSLNQRNARLQAKYEDDAKFMRIHKRLVEKKMFSQLESRILTVLTSIKQDADEKVLLNTNMLKNEGFFNQLMMQTMTTNFDRQGISVDLDSAKFINNSVVKEYVNEFTGTKPW